MTGEPSALLALARDDLAAARRDLDANPPRHAVSRAYYATFHAVSAVLVIVDAPAKSHKGTHSQFHREFVRTGRLPASDGQVLAALFQLRQDADYDVGQGVSMEQAERAVRDAAALVDDLAAWMAADGNNAP